MCDRIVKTLPADFSRFVFALVFTDAEVRHHRTNDADADAERRRTRYDGAFVFWKTFAQELHTAARSRHDDDRQLEPGRNFLEEKVLLAVQRLPNLGLIAVLCAQRLDRAVPLHLFKRALTIANRARGPRE